MFMAFGGKGRPRRQPSSCPPQGGSPAAASCFSGRERRSFRFAARCESPWLPRRGFSRCRMAGATLRAEVRPDRAGQDGGGQGEGGGRGWNSPLSNGCALRWAGCCLVASWPRTGGLGSQAAQASTQTWHLRLPTLGQVVLRHGLSRGPGSGPRSLERR